MNKRELAGRLRDSTEAMRLQPSEVEHMLDMMADWGCLAVDDEPRPANAQLEGAEAPADNVPMIEPVTDLEEEYDDSDEDDDDEESESESERRELVTPRVHRTKTKTKTKTKTTPARRSHR